MRARTFVAAMAVAAAATFATTVANTSAATTISKPSIPKCALGKLPPPLKDVIPTGIAAAEQRFVRSQNLTGKAADRAGRLFAASEAAYLYGMPSVLMRLTVQFPTNALLGAGQLASPESRVVVSPNNDTLYSASNIDLSSGPLIIEAPATDGRYSILQLMDAYTNSFAYVGSGSDRDSPQTIALVPPGWSGDIPGAEIVQSPSFFVWLLGRTLVEGEEDLDNATALMSRYSLTPLADWRAGARNSMLVVPTTPPRINVVLPTGLEFFDALGERLAANPPPFRDDCAMKVFNGAGIAPGTKPSTGTDPLLLAAQEAGAIEGAKLVERSGDVVQEKSASQNRGWVFTRPDAGLFGRDYSYRAVIADRLLAANAKEEAIYPRANVDTAGRPLSGEHDYVVKFAKGATPPVNEFWSMTMYDSENFLVDNQIDRYAVGDRTDGLAYGKGGSLKIYVQREAPSGGKAANWLPSAEGAFSMILRLYEPKRAGYSGKWEPPKIIRVR